MWTLFSKEFGGHLWFIEKLTQGFCKDLILFSITGMYTKSSKESLFELVTTACQSATKHAQLCLPNVSDPFRIICMKFLLQES